MARIRNVQYLVPFILLFVCLFFFFVKSTPTFSFPRPPFYLPSFSRPLSSNSVFVVRLKKDRQRYTLPAKHRIVLWDRQHRQRTTKTDTITALVLQFVITINICPLVIKSLKLLSRHRPLYSFL